MNLFKERYRVESSRLKGWDYTSVGYYFVTICTRNRECYLGNVVDGVMRLSPAGKIVDEEWQKTAVIRENVTLDEWVVMPNHLHGIIVINSNTPHRGVSTDGTEHCRDVPMARLDVARIHKDSLGAIIGQFKSVCTKRIWTADHDFAWQSRFYDEIIRDERSLETIREYIRNNPMQWHLDKENPANYPK